MLDPIIIWKLHRQKKTFFKDWIQYRLTWLGVDVNDFNRKEFLEALPRGFH